MDAGKTFRGQWCFDSETGESVLIDLETNQIVLRKERHMADSITGQTGYEKGRKDAFDVAEYDIIELKAQVRELEYELDALKRKIANYINLGVDAFRLEKNNES